MEDLIREDNTEIKLMTFKTVLTPLLKHGRVHNALPFELTLESLVKAARLSAMSPPERLPIFCHFLLEMTVCDKGLWVYFKTS